MKALSKNAGVKGVALAITFLLCLNAETDRMVEVDCAVPLQYVNLPDSLVQMGEPISEAQVRVIFNRKFWQLQPGNLVALIDLAAAGRGTHRFTISPEDIAIPHDRKARVVDIIEPKRIALTFEPRIRADIKVLPVAQGAPGDGFVVFQEPRVEPERVTVIGARSIVERIEALGTLPIDLTGLREDRSEIVRVDLTEWEGVITDPIEVEVFYDLEKIEDRTLAKRSIRMSPRSGTRVIPDSLDLVVRGPGARLDEIPESRIRLSLNVEPINSAGEFSYLAEVMEGNRIRFYRQLSDGTTEEVALPDLEGAVQNLPDQVVVVDFSPKVFRIVRGGS